MQFGLYGTNGHVTVGSAEIAKAVLEARGPLAEGRQDAAVRVWTGRDARRRKCRI